ncbi:MAG: ABC transporter ATP-binding protein [Nitrososphaera sp.]
MEAILTKHVSKSFGNVKAVSGLNLAVPAGEIRGLLGPNGSGKSTAMKMIMGILPPDQGEIFVNDINVRAQPVESRRYVGYVPEIPQIYDYLTAAEYLDFIGEAYGIPSDVRKKRVEEFLGAFQMADRVNEVMSGFSQGMRQKIAITAALLHRPKVLVLDEALNGLDPRSARIVKEILHRLARDEQVAVLFSTHILEIAEGVCQRVTIMSKGAVLAEGSVQELRSMTGMQGSSLEDVFLKLTGSEDTARIAEALRY